MWQKIKANWKEYLLASLTALVGWLSTDKAMEYSTQAEGPPGRFPRTEELAPGPDNTWEVEAWFTAAKVAKAPGRPEMPYTDNLGRYVVQVDSEKQPTTRQIVEAFGKELNPESITLEVVSVTPPPGWKEPGPGPDEPEEQ